MQKKNILQKKVLAIIGILAIVILGTTWVFLQAPQEKAPEGLSYGVPNKTLSYGVSNPMKTVPDLSPVINPFKDLYKNPFE